MAHCKSLGQARLIFNNEIPIILLPWRFLQKYCSKPMSIVNQNENLGIEEKETKESKF